MTASNNHAGLFDSSGFLIDPNVWSITLAGCIAEAGGLGKLNNLQSGLLFAVRNAFARHGWSPHLATSVSPDNARIAWCVAGLPDPGEAARAYCKQAGSRFASQRFR